jgi:hypothetical protein
MTHLERSVQRKGRNTRPRTFKEVVAAQDSQRWRALNLRRSCGRDAGLPMLSRGCSPFAVKPSLVGRPASPHNAPP